MMLVFLAACLLDRHEVDNFTDSIIGEEAREENICFRHVELFMAYIRRAQGRYGEEATLIGIEQCAKDARGVKTRYAAPVNRTILADQRDCVQITNDGVVLNRQVRCGGTKRFFYLCLYLCLQHKLFPLAKLVLASVQKSILHILATIWQCVKSCRVRFHFVALSTRCSRDR